jgi:hypothetical protein
MSARTVIAGLLLCCAFVPLTVHAGPPVSASRTKLALRDWSVNASPNLATSPPSKKVVLDFLISLTKARGGEAAAFGGKEIQEAFTIGGTRIRSFRFADLRHGAFLSLVMDISSGYGPHRASDTIEIVDRTALGFEEYDGVGFLDDIEDLGHDGNLEVLVDNSMGEFPDHCEINWTKIYAWTGQNYTNVSDKFKGFYRQRLKTLNRIIPTLQPLAPPKQPGGYQYPFSYKECLEAEASAIEGFLGVSQDAGIAQAVRLATSKDRNAREFACMLLAGIKTPINIPKAREYLARLANDKDRIVAMDAKRALAVLARRAKHPERQRPETFHRYPPKPIPASALR